MREDHAVTAPSRPQIFDPGLESLWKHTLDHWDDEKAHAAFLQHCQTANQLAEAAVRYRGMTGDRTRAEVAEKKLKSVAVLAMAQLETQRSTGAPKGRLQLFTFLAFLLLLATMIGLFVAYGLR